MNEKSSEDRYDRMDSPKDDEQVLSSCVPNYANHNHDISSKALSFYVVYMMIKKEYANFDNRNCPFSFCDTFSSMDVHLHPSDVWFL